MKPTATTPYATVRLANVHDLAPPSTEQQLREVCGILKITDADIDANPFDTLDRIEVALHQNTTRMLGVAVHLFNARKRKRASTQRQSVTATVLASLSSVPLVPPAPRLVGIELNPGPLVEEVSHSGQLVVIKKKKNNKKKKNPKTKPRKKTTQLVTLTSSRTGRSPLQQVSARASLKNYIRALCDPMFAQPVRLGWGTFVPTSLRTAYSRSGIAAGGTTTCFAFRATPTFVIATSITGGTSGFLSGFEAVTSNTVLSASTGVVNFGAVNAAALGTVIDTARLVSMCFRFTVRYAATSVRGSLFGMYIPDDTGNSYVAQQFIFLGAQFQSRTAIQTAPGELTIEVQYRPTDASSFSFNSIPTTSQSAGVSIPQLIVVGAGWTPGTFGYEYSIVAHYETLGGLDNGGDDTSDGDSLAVNGVTMDAAGQAAAQAGDPVVTSGYAIASLDAAMSTIASSRRGMGGRAKPGLGMFSSMPGPATYSGSASSSSLQHSASSPPICSANLPVDDHAFEIVSPLLPLPNTK